MIRRMRVVRALVVAAAALAAFGCSSDSRSLDDWVAEADEICADAHAQTEELGIEDLDDVRENGEAAVELAEGAIDDLDDLEPPSDADDAERAEDLVDQLDTLVDLQRDALELATEGNDDIGLLLSPLDYADQIEEGAEGAEDVGSDDCRDVLDERLDGIERIQGAADELGPLADVRVGDCVTGIDDELRPADCEDDRAEGTVVSTGLEDRSGACAAEAQPVTVSGAQFCIDAFGPPPESDGLLQVGSCITLTRGANDTVNVTELGCADAGVTHTVVDDVRAVAACPPQTRRFAKTAEEIADSGRGDWCAERR
jgi:hypothetical protein